MSDTTIIETTETTASKTSAKNTSHIAQIVAAIWISGWSAFKFIANPAQIGMEDVIFSGVGIAACFLPVYFSIIMDKIKDIRIGGK